MRWAEPDVRDEVVDYVRLLVGQNGVWNGDYGELDRYIPQQIL